jgi:hypothetical protein
MSEDLRITKTQLPLLDSTSTVHAPICVSCALISASMANAGTLCLTGSYDGTVGVYKVSDGTKLQTLEGACWCTLLP